jgi:hypothetical protein
MVGILTNWRLKAVSRPGFVARNPHLPHGERLREGRQLPEQSLPEISKSATAVLPPFLDQIVAHG